MATLEYKDSSAQSPIAPPARSLRAQRLQWLATAAILLQVPNATTADTAWEPLPNPHAGLDEIRWFESKPNELFIYRGLWVAVKGNSIVASGESFNEAYDQTTVPDALIIYIPNDFAEEGYFIA